jgi:hypothetical protein
VQTALRAGADFLGDQRERLRHAPSRSSSVWMLPPDDTRTN